MTGGMAYRGAQQPRSQRQPGHHRPQRQRPLLRPDGLPPVREPDPAAPASRPQHRCAARVEDALPRPARRSAAWPTRSLQGLYSAVREMPRAAGVLRGARRPLRRPDRRPRHRRHGAGPAQRQPSFDGPDRRPRAHPEGPGLRARRGRRREAPARRPGLRPGRRTAPRPAAPTGYTQAFTEAMLKEASATRTSWPSPRPCPARPGCCPSRPRFPDRFFDVGIAEQHAVTSAAGMAMGGLRPVVAVYSTFFNRAFDQVNLDVGLHGLPVVFALDRAGITGDDGPSHHGVLDMALCLKVPGMTVFAPSSAQELRVMLQTPLEPGRPGRHPLARRARPARSSRTARSARACAPAGSGEGDGDGLHPGRRQDGRSRRGGGRHPARPRASTPPCGTSGWSARSTRR